MNNILKNYRFYLQYNLIISVNKPTLCATKSSYTTQTPMTVIPCSLHSIAMVTRAIVTSRGLHSDFTQTEV